MNKMFIYRNHAVEYLFPKNTVQFSGYDDIMTCSKNVEEILFLYFIPYNSNTSEIVDLIDEYYNYIKFIVENHRDKIIYICTLYDYFSENFIFNDNILDEAINSFNSKIYGFKDNVHIIDMKGFFKDYSLNCIFDLKYYYLYNCIITPKYSKEFYEWIISEINLFKQVRKKCLILDLDNTIWGGVLGEDGIQSLHISGNYPGNAYHDFQKLILELKKIGIILCICSKNNELDVKECFDKRDDLVLDLNDITVCSVSWNRKDIQIKDIIEKLNILPNSVVFIDDNPAERELVKNSIPELEILDFPKEPYMLVNHFKKYFRKLFGLNCLTNEEINKSGYYKNKILADIEKKNFTNENEFISNLKIKLTFQKMNEYNQQRIVQIINKTNQFNLTSKRYNLTDLQSLNKDSVIYCVSVSDKFGELGICGVAIVRINCCTAFIDSFMLSCRIIGRKIEFEFLKMIMNSLVEQNIKEVYAEYIPTSKNSQTKNFYKDFSFNILKQDNKKTVYKYNLDKKFDLDLKYKVKIVT